MHIGSAKRRWARWVSWAKPGHWAMWHMAHHCSLIALQQPRGGSSPGGKEPRPRPTRRRPFILFVRNKAAAIEAGTRGRAAEMRPAPQHREPSPRPAQEHRALMSARAPPWPCQAAPVGSCRPACRCSPGLAWRSRRWGVRLSWPLAAGRLRVEVSRCP